MNRSIIANPSADCPQEIIEQQYPLQVMHWNFAFEACKGTIEMHHTVIDDVADFFKLAYELRFPIERVVRASEDPFRWDDTKLMEANASSGFNYRTIAGSSTLSHHSKGLAFDINTRLNPYIREVDGQKIVAPQNAVWQPAKPGVLDGEHPLVRFMIERGWIWGGHWTFEDNGMVDYQHFQTQHS